MGGLQYPKHVWSPAGGWNSQPANWKGNTAVMLGVIVGITAMAWTYSANHEVRTKYPEPGRFYPSRYWSKDVIANEKAQRQQMKKSESS